MTTYLVITESAWEGPQEYSAETRDEAYEIADYLRDRQYQVRIKELVTNDL